MAFLFYERGHWSFDRDFIESLNPFVKEGHFEKNNYSNP
jgi:hypothetical protein